MLDIAFKYCYYTFNKTTIEDLNYGHFSNQT